MRIVPDSTINLFSGVEIDNGENLVFSSKANRTAYFASKLVRQAVPCTVVRKTGALRLEVAGTVVGSCNYISFLNPSFDNKIIYARIVDYEYINNECTEIQYAIDYWQTWGFDVTFQSSYIKREHLSESDWTKAEANPYDPTIYEFRTDEKLNIDKDLEKLNYTIGSNSDNGDGFRMSNALIGSGQIDTVGVLCKISAINFQYLEDQGQFSPSPSERFLDYLNTIMAGSPVSFYILTKEFCRYVESKFTASYWQQQWPNLPITVNQGQGTYTVAYGACGSAWHDHNNNATTPFTSSRLMPECFYVFDGHGGSFYYHNGEMSTLLSMLTEWSGTMPINDVLIDARAIPNQIMLFAGNLVTGGYIQNPTPLTFGQKTAKTFTNVTSKKLLRYPYSYLRLIAPNGDIKEYQYERFADTQNGLDQCTFYTSLDFSDTPTIIITPVGYKMNNDNVLNIPNNNILEALFFNQFPTVPLAIDSWTAQVAAVANNCIANRSLDFALDMRNQRLQSDEISEITKEVSTVGQGILNATAGIAAGNASGVANGLAASMSMRGMSSEYTTSRDKYGAIERRYSSAEEVFSGADGTEIAKQICGAKPAFACDKYYPSNGIGNVNFNYLSFVDFILLRVSLSNDVLQIYDQYFQHYGYTSGRCGIPRVVNYIHGSSTPTEVPHWETVDGRPTTYIQTMDCKVIHSMVPVANAIKSMFDGGVRFIKGDLQTP